MPVPPRQSGLHRSIAHVSALLDRLGRQNEALDERYNQAAALVAASQRRADAAERTARTAAAAATRARNRLAMAAAQRYEAGSVDTTGLLLTSATPEDYLNNLSSLDLVSGQFATLRSSAATAAQRAHTLAAQATARLASARSKEQALRHQRSRLAARTAHYKHVLAGLSEQQRQAYARARSVALARARAIAAAQAAQARARTQSPPRSTTAPAPPAPGASVAASSAAVQRVVDFAEAQVARATPTPPAGPTPTTVQVLTMASWQQAGVSLPHQASAQYNVGTHVSYDQLQPGDLIFLTSRSATSRSTWAPTSRCPRPIRRWASSTSTRRRTWPTTSGPPARNGRTQRPPRSVRSRWAMPISPYG